MLLKNKYRLFGAALFLIGIQACKKWDDHIALRDNALQETLVEHMAAEPSLSVFNEYLHKTGLDRELAGERSYTVWAPSNTALETLPSSITGDSATLRRYMENHIAGQVVFTRMATDSLRVRLLNGKRIFANGKKFDDANITKEDVAVKNGVLHIVDKLIAPQPSIWEFIEQTKSSFEQNNYIAALNYQSQDPELAELDSINPATGDPVYKPNTGIVTINTFRTKVYDIANEDSLYTYVVLNNAAYQSATQQQRPYFNSADPAITDANASWNVVKDLAIRGLHAPNQLQQALYSRFMVRIPVNSSNIVETHKVSNGIVYVVNQLDTDITEKIPSFIVQGEVPLAVSNMEDRFLTKIMYRERKNPNTGNTFKDIYLNLGSSGANYFVDYRTNNLFTTKYRVYWVAFSDRVLSGQADDAYGTDSTLTQLLQVGPYTADGLFTPAFNVTQKVAPLQYEEILLGEYTLNEYNWKLSHPESTPDGQSYIVNPATQRIRLRAPASASSGIPLNLTLDYIRFVPVQ